MNEKITDPADLREGDRVRFDYSSGTRESTLIKCGFTLRTKDSDVTGRRQNIVYYLSTGPVWGGDISNVVRLDARQDDGLAKVCPGDTVTVSTIYGCTVTGQVEAAARNELFLDGWTLRYPDGKMGSKYTELINHQPAKPAEPTGLGAVVRDSRGLWTRADDDFEPWFNVGYDWRSWDDFDHDVEVLHVGISVD